MSAILGFLLTFFTNNLVGILVGLFIGWHVPMPAFMSTIYTQAVDWFFGLFKSAAAWLWGKITGQ